MSRYSKAIAAAVAAAIAAMVGAGFIDPAREAGLADAILVILTAAGVYAAPANAE